MGMKTGQRIKEEQNIYIRKKIKGIFSKIAGKLVSISPTLFAVLVSFLVLWNQYNSHFTLTNLEMNLIFLAMFTVSLILTVWAHANRRKCIWLIGISVAIVEVYFYNGLDSSSSFLTDLIKFWRGFNHLWSKLLFLMLISLLIVGIRVICWSQEDWEEIRKNKVKCSVSLSCCNRCRSTGLSIKQRYLYGYGSALFEWKQREVAVIALNKKGSIYKNLAKNLLIETIIKRV